MSAVEVVLASQADSNGWDAYVAGHPEATGYHEWAWRSVFEQAFGHRCLYVVARRGDCTVGVLPLVLIKSLLFGRSLTSLPFLNYGGVLADTDVAKKALLQEASRLASQHNCRHVELRHTARQFDELPFKQHKVTMRLELKEGLWDRLDRKARNQVRKAQKSGLTVERGGASLLPQFYEVFARNMRDLGTPVYSRGLFDAVLAAFPGRARIIVVRLENKPVAAGLTIQTKGMVEIPWASSVRDYNNLCPNHLLYWHALETSLAEGVTTFDFGRSTPGEGTYKFKEQWGATPLALNWEYWLPAGDTLPDQSPKNPKFRLMIETWKHLPLWFANAAGPRIVRDIP
jgi:serine/alanine adding enzyme